MFRAAIYFFPGTEQTVHCYQSGGGGGGGAGQVGKGGMTLGILGNAKETSEARTCFEHQKPGGSASKPQMERMVCSTHVSKLKPVK